MATQGTVGYVLHMWGEPSPNMQHYHVLSRFCHVGVLCALVHAEGET